MYIRKFLIVAISIAILNACAKSGIEHVENKDISSLSAKDSILADVPKQNEADFIDSFAIDRKQHREILNLLTLIPDNSRGSWDWTSADRTRFVADALKTGYIVDSNPQYLNVLDLTSSTIMIQVVDGIWKMSVYEINETDKIVITSDVTDQDELHAYKVSGDVVKEIPIKEIFPDERSYFIKEPVDAKCNELLKTEYGLILDHDISENSRITVTCRYAEDDEDAACFKGNTLELNFDPVQEKFAFHSIYWQDYSQNGMD